MIDIAYEVQKFYPVDISAIPADDKYSENVRLAFALYNKAIQKINKGYEDLARIDLKKAVQLYPNFYVAIVLLGMCTFANGDRIGAVRIFNSVKDPDMREKALNYLDYLANEMDKVSNYSNGHKEIREDEIFAVKMQSSTNVSKSFDKFEVIEVDDTDEQLTLKIEPPENIETKVKEVKPEPQPIVLEVKKEEPVQVKESKISNYVKKADEPLPEKQVKKDGNNKMFYVGYVALVIIIAVLGISLLSTMSENGDLKDSLSLYTGKTGDIKPTQKPTEKTATSTPTLAPTATPIDYYALTASQIKECIKNYNFKQYYEVVELYHTIKMDYVPEEQKANLNKIYNQSLESFSNQNYSSSFSLTNQKKYEEVIELLLPILKYNPNFKNTDAVVFYIGKSYEEIKNYTKAKEYYNIVIDKYPGTDYANWAAYRLIVIG